MGFRTNRRQRLNRDPLDLVWRDLVVGSIVEIGRSQRLVRRDLLRVFERSAILEVGGDAGGAERVATDFGFDPGGSSSSADHSPGIRLVQGIGRESPTRCDRDRAEEGSLLLIPKLRRFAVGVEVLLKGVVAGQCGKVLHARARHDLQGVKGDF